MPNRRPRIVAAHINAATQFTIAGLRLNKKPIDVSAIACQEKYQAQTLAFSACRYFGIAETAKTGTHRKLPGGTQPSSFVLPYKNKKRPDRNPAPFKSNIL